MNLAEVMDEIASRLHAVDGLRVYPYPPDEVAGPAGIVSWPEISFDQTYGRGTDRMSLPVVILVAKTVDRVDRAAIAPYCAGSGPSSIKVAIESPGQGNSFDIAHVASVELGEMALASTEYVSATFTLDIIGQGA